MRRLSLVVLLAGSFGCLLLSGICAAAEPAPYKIGVCVALTGPAANIGAPNRNGALIRIAEINAAGGINGRKLEGVVDDEQAQPDKAVIDTKRLIDIDKVVALVGYEYSGAGLAAIGPSEAGATPMIVGCVSEKTWTPTKKWVFSVVPSQKSAYNILLDNLQQLGAKNVALIYVDAAMGEMGREALLFDTQKRGIKVTTIEKYSLGTTDMSPQITHIKASGAEALFLAGYVGDAAMVVKSARSLGFTGPIAGDQAVLGPEFIKLVGKDGEGFLTTGQKAFVAHELPDNDVQKKIAVELLDKYTKEYGSFALGGAHGWDEVTLIGLALQKVDPKLDPTKPEDLVKIRAAIRDNLENLGDVVAQNGTYKITPDNHNGLPPDAHIALVIKDGKWSPVKK